MKVLIVLPSYNEAQNISQMLDALFMLGNEYFVCVVDDNSPDGTPQVLQKYQAALSPDKANRFHFIIRTKKDGRGGAVRDGIKWGLQKDFDSFVEMDCDFSHPPTDIPKGVAMLRSSDVVMGSRYPDGKIVGWSMTRKVFSIFANLLARTLISWRIADYTNGFRFYTRRAAAFICEQPQKHKGYIYLSETISYFLKNGFTIASFPILFVNRERGVSNTGIKEVASALLGIFQIAWEYRFHGK